jgi:hypothetical protein
MSDIWHYSFNEKLASYRNKWCPLLLGGRVVVPRGKTFWFLRLGTFEGFLDRRSRISRKPKKHFPTVETYGGVKFKYSLVYKDFDETTFVSMYDRLKRKGHHSARTVLGDVRLPKAYSRIAMLDDLGICWLADDGKSASLLNLASVIDNRGIGKIMLTEVVRYLCEHGYHSFDAGVSGDYGGYKKSIFLDSICG